MTRTRIVGVGAITALGQEQQTFDAILEGRTGIAPPVSLDLPDLPDVVVAEVDSAAEAPQGAPLRALSLARRTARRAIDEAGWTTAPDALIVASTKGGIALAQGVMERRIAAAALADFPLFAPAARLAAELSVTGVVQTVSLACASGTAAIGHAKRLIDARRADRVLVVGVDALCEFIVRGFAGLRALGHGPARPFDAGRTGLTVGEGAAALALQRDQGGLAVLGYGGTNDANHITGPDPQGRGLAAAIDRALAGTPPEEIVAASLHGTGTPYNDAMEGQALTRVFERAPPSHSLKGALGHTLGAAGVVEAVVAVLAHRRGVWPPTVGCRTPDPEIPITTTLAPTPLSPGPILSTSAGFSGVNAAVVIG